MKTSISVAKLHELITPVLGFASKDETLPILCSVHIVSTPTGLMAEATNRYVLGRSFVDCDTAGEFEALIHIKAARAVLRTFPRGKTALDRLCTLELAESSEGKLTVSGQTGNPWMPEAALTLDLIGGDYPKLGVLFDKVAANKDRILGLTPQHVETISAALAAADFKTIPAKVTFPRSPAQPVHITQDTLVGRFEALIQPARIAGDAE